ncbi:Wsc Domain-Containing Protein 1 [Manis pentadactyla]|nr:Wsc Domain-Containing Protein 1 [Manis pentadactyla]
MRKAVLWQGRLISLKISDSTCVDKSVQDVMARSVCGTSPGAQRSKGESSGCSCIPTALYKCTQEEGAAVA